MRFGNPHKIELVFFPLRRSALLILPRPHLATDNIFQTGDRHCNAEDFTSAQVPEEILVPIMARKLDIDLASRTLRVGQMREPLHAEPDGFEFAFNPFETRRYDDYIGISRVNRLDKAIHRQSADQTPRFMTVQHGNDFREIARAALCD
jgi:hypothetical protein